MTDASIRAAFAGAGDFISRTLNCGSYTLYAYAIDGLVSGGDMSDYVLKPISENLRGESMEELYAQALEQLTGKPVRERYIVFLNGRACVRL